MNELDALRQEAETLKNAIRVSISINNDVILIMGCCIWRDARNGILSTKHVFRWMIFVDLMEGLKVSDERWRVNVIGNLSS